MEMAREEKNIACLGTRFHHHTLLMDSQILALSLSLSLSLNLCECSAMIYNSWNRREKGTSVYMSLHNCPFLSLALPYDIRSDYCNWVLKCSPYPERATLVNQACWKSLPNIALC
ncbi:hypothetical protein KP509_11G080100 [Ceratopteris richardii]|uniref:Uncharacterized protein n=1 Tax=Ceratopteris richardii TaxID=49495 RepID=A0A8T2TWK7_CERRI|nr:hypothetical protein KP509_11G080100 [Ceratopteris richardii]